MLSRSGIFDAYFTVHFLPASKKNHEKGRAEARPWFTNMVGDRRIELLTSSVSRKRSTSELIAQRDEILLANVRPVNSLSGFGALRSQRLKLLIFSV